MERKLWVDVLKGLGILFVVAGHIYGGKIRHYIFIFHMPLFFYISGYLFRPTIKLKEYFKKKCIHLLIPYISFLSTLYLFYEGLPSLTTEDLLNYFSKPIIGGKMLIGPFAVFWFITCLFLTQQIMNYLITKFTSKTLHYLIVIILIIGYCNSIFFPKIWLPWNANIVFASIPIFYIGYLVQIKNFKMNNLVLLILGGFVILFSSFYPENVYDMKFTQYGIPLITLLSSVILIQVFQTISFNVSKLKSLSVIFSSLGKSSMVIMYIHIPVIILIKSHFSPDNFTLFLIVTLISYVVFLLLSNFKIGKAFYLGSYYDLKRLFKF